MRKLKIISLLCTLAMLVGCFAVFPAFAEETERRWTWNDAGGVEGMTYLLDNGNFNMFWAQAKGKNVKGNYKLTESIVINEGNAVDWVDASKRPSGTDANSINKVWNSPIGGTGSFDGTFDGQGFTISGICLVSAGSYHLAGLFGTVNGTVRNLRLINSYFECTASATDVDPSGSIAAKLNGSVINCYSEAILNNKNPGTSNMNGSPVGGIVGRATGESRIENCVFAGQILDSMGPTGGIFGSNSYNSCSVTVSNCLNLGSVHSTNSYAAPIVGRAYTYNDVAGVVINNCMNLGTVMGAKQNMDGEIVGVGAGCFTVTNYILIKGFRIANVGLIGNSPATVISSGVHEKSLANLLNTETKVFADWDYKAGYIPNPTTFEIDKLSLASFADKLNAEMLELKSEGEIHSVRISADNPGLRFETFVNADVIDALKAAGATVTMKTIITSADFIGDADTATTTATFTKAALEAKQMPYLEMEAKEYLHSVAKGDDYTGFAGSVVNIKNLDMKYIAVGYITITFGDDSYDIYATWNADEKTSVSEVATKAADDYSAEKNEAKGHVNPIKLKGSSETVYSRYTQEQYDIIVKLCSL